MTELKQDDGAERAAQVNLMGDIYASASETLIWLGPDLDVAWIFRWFHKTFLPGLKAMVGARKAREKMISGFVGLLNPNHVPKSDKQIEEECLEDLRLKDPIDPVTWELMVEGDLKALSWLNRGQKIGALAITGAFRTVATAVAEAEASILSIRERHTQGAARLWINAPTLSRTHPFVLKRNTRNRAFCLPTSEDRPINGMSMSRSDGDYQRVRHPTLGAPSTDKI
ncbi:hypothetical protein V8F06_006071 [Rhypophila decipiens]